MKTDNELIAEFMGSKIHTKWTEYDTSWDWLMPVVEKIEMLYKKAFPPGDEFVRRILANEKILDGPYMDVVALPLSTSIGEVYKAVVDFIKWYNQQKNGRSD